MLLQKYKFANYNHNINNILYFIFKVSFFFLLMTFSYFVLTSIKDISNENRTFFKSLTISYVNMWYGYDIMEESFRYFVSMVNHLNLQFHRFSITIVYRVKVIYVHWYVESIYWSGVQVVHWTNIFAVIDDFHLMLFFSSRTTVILM